MATCLVLLLTAPITRDRDRSDDSQCNLLRLGGPHLPLLLRVHHQGIRNIPLREESGKIIHSISFFPGIGLWLGILLAGGLVVLSLMMLIRNRAMMWGGIGLGSAGLNGLLLLCLDVRPWDSEKKSDKPPSYLVPKGGRGVSECVQESFSVSASRERAGSVSDGTLENRRLRFRLVGRRLLQFGLAPLGGGQLVEQRPAAR